MSKLKEIPIFPLPNAVFFPKTFLPLHVFEPRYRAMVENADKHDNLMGIVLLKEGWEQDYFGSPAVHDIACVGRIEQVEKLQDGKYNIMLYGIGKVKIEQFIQEKPYRVAQVRYLKEVKFDPAEVDEETEARSFIRLIKTYLVEIGVENSHEVVSIQNYSLESIVNQIAAILDFPAEDKQALLELKSLKMRYDQLQGIIKDQLQTLRIARQVKFVPEDPTLN